LVDPAPILEKPLHSSRYRNCSVARTLDIISDAWSFLTLREVFFGVHRFEEFQSNLEIPRATLTSRLKRLVAEGILKKVPYSEHGSRYAYHFTRKGIELYPVMVALLKWGDDWLLREGEDPPLALYHKICGHWTTPQIVCSECTGLIDARQVTHRPGPGAGWDAEVSQQRNRRSSKPSEFRKSRNCSVGRSLSVIGDRWTFMVMRETFFRVRRYDDFLANLGIATNILSNRLQQLVADGLLRKELYQERPERYEYRQTPQGTDLFGACIVMIAWADKWLSGNEGIPLILTHETCERDFSAKVVCGECGGLLNAWDMSGAGF